MIQVQEESELLQAALRDIAYALIQDAEAKDIEMSHATHVHLSSTPVPQKYLLQILIKLYILNKCFC